MEPLPGPLDLGPLSSDGAAAVELCREALVAAFARSGSAADAEPRIQSVSAKIRSGEMNEGALVRIEGRPAGVALWETGHPSGVVVQTLYLRPPAGRPARYEAVFRALIGWVGPFVFSPGGLVGLSDVEETVLMESLGYGRFSRSEMRWPAEREPPTVRAPNGVQIRPVRAEDEPTVAVLHRSAFEGTFDQYLYLTDPDPAVDAARAIREIVSGQYGEFLGWASTFAESGSRALGASLVVRASYGPLLISVMVDRAAQGAGLGRALVGENLHALRSRKETFAALNVTEGNTRAVRLYEHLGFVRSIGPEHSWYSRAAIPVAPGAAPIDPTPPTDPSTRGSGASRTPRT
jgi:ribosomal protein S18 acetylase RimI-like enzyme